MLVENYLASLQGSRYLKLQQVRKNKHDKKLASGYQINTAADNAASLTISERMRSKIRGLDQASVNGQDGISLCQTVDGLLEEVHALLQRNRELSVQSANGTYTDADRKQIQDEVNQNLKEIKRITEEGEYNTIPLFQGIMVSRVEGSTWEIDGIKVDEKYLDAIFRGSVSGKTLEESIGELQVVSDWSSITGEMDKNTRELLELQITVLDAFRTMKTAIKTTGASTTDQRKAAAGFLNTTITKLLDLQNRGFVNRNIAPSKLEKFTQISTNYTTFINNPTFDNWKNVCNYNISRELNNISDFLTNNQQARALTEPVKALYQEMFSATVGFAYHAGLPDYSQLKYNDNVLKNLEQTIANWSSSTLLNYVKSDLDKIGGSTLKAYIKDQNRDGIESEMKALTNRQKGYAKELRDRLGDLQKIMEMDQDGDQTMLVKYTNKAQAKQAIETLITNIETDIDNEEFTTDIYTSLNTIAGYFADGSFLKNWIDNFLKPVATAQKNAAKIDTTLPTLDQAMNTFFKNLLEEASKGSQMKLIDTQFGRDVLARDWTAVEIGLDNLKCGLEYDGTYDVTKNKPTILSLQVGSNGEERIELCLDPLYLQTLGINKLNIEDEQNAQRSIGRLDGAIEKLSKIRAAVGAVQNRLEVTVTSLDNLSEQAQSSESRIRDSNMAKEQEEAAKDMLMIGANQLLLAQEKQRGEKIKDLVES